jgi:uncharacterized membrane protein
MYKMRFYENDRCVRTVRHLQKWSAFILSRKHGEVKTVIVRGETMTVFCYATYSSVNPTVTLRRYSNGKA